MTDASRFLALLYTQPMLRSDAIVVLAGEDSEIRYRVGVELFRQGGAPLLVFSGGRHEPPVHMGAVELRKKALGAGIAPDRIIVEGLSANTRDQAIEVLSLCTLREWKRILLCCSAYHLARAFLTFLAADPDDVHIVPVPAPGKWSEKPDGMEQSRLELFAREQGRILAYQNKGHVASYADGIDYLLRMENPA